MSGTGQGRGLLAKTGYGGWGPQHLPHDARTPEADSPEERSPPLTPSSRQQQQRLGLANAPAGDEQSGGEVLCAPGAWPWVERTGMTAPACERRAPLGRASTLGSSQTVPDDLEPLLPLLSPVGGGTLREEKGQLRATAHLAKASWEAGGPGATTPPLVAVAGACAVGLQAGLLRCLVVMPSV